MRLALPFHDAEEMKHHGAVFVDVHARDPRVGLADTDAELLKELAAQRLGERLALLHLAAGEFPPAGVDLAGRTLCEEKRAVRPLEDGRYDLNHFFLP